jgi:hypothetical protein
VKIPHIADPARYTGLYIVDFGDHVSAGYTAREVSFLLDDERFAGARVYQIHRVHPDGGLDLRGVTTPDFGTQEAMLFFRRDASAARSDFDTLVRLAARTPPPCAVAVELTSLHDTADALTALRYSAESSAALGAWLNAIGFAGGDRVEGGRSAANDYRNADKDVLAARQLFPPPERTSRSLDEVLATTHLPLQR